MSSYITTMSSKCAQTAKIPQYAVLLKNVTVRYNTVALKEIEVSMSFVLS